MPSTPSWLVTGPPSPRACSSAYRRKMSPNTGEAYSDAFNPELARNWSAVSQSVFCSSPRSVATPALSVAPPLSRKYGQRPKATDPPPELSIWSFVAAEREATTADLVPEHLFVYSLEESDGIHSPRHTGLCRSLGGNKKGQI